MAYTPINPSQTQAKAVIDEQLMDTGLRLNLSDHEARLLTLEALVGGADQEIDITQLYAKLETDPRFVSNEGVLFLRRFHADSNFNSNVPTIEYNTKDLVDIESNDPNFLYTYQNGKADGTINHYQQDDFYFKGSTAALEKDSEVQFYIKEPFNYFGIGIGRLFTDMCDSVTVLIDGQTPSSLGLTDLDGNAATDTFSANSTQIQYQRTVYYFGLGPGRHLVTLKNTDSASKEFYFNFVDVGYISRDFTIDHKLTMQDFKASIKGVSTNFTGQEIDIPESEGYGHTAIVVGSASGSLRAIKGLEGAYTTLRANQTVEFSNPVTELLCKNTTYFQDKGICIFHHPNGPNFIFSYNSKTETLIQDHRLSDIVWQKQPNTDFDVEQGFENSDTLGAGRPNALISFWAKPTIEIDSGTNKLDFEITIIDNTGTPITTAHTATIPEGAYSSDLVPITEAIEKAMWAAKPLSSEDGRYLVQWDKTTKRYRLGVQGKNIDSISFEFATGPNFASSIHPVLGYNDIDLDGEKIYYANDIKAHAAIRAYLPDTTSWTHRHPNIKWNDIASNATLFAYRDVLQRRGIGDIEVFSGNGVTGNAFPQCTIHPDKDAVGITIGISSHANLDSCMLEIAIDDGDQMVIYDSDNMSGTNTAEHRPLDTIFIPFPRGSKKIQIAANRYNAFGTGTTGSGVIDLVAIRQWFSRPYIEDIDLDSEQIIKALDVAPHIPRFKTIFGNNLGSLYVPDGSDPIDSISETGASWAAVGPGGYFNGYARDAQTNGDYIEIQFTIPSGGKTGYGGIGVMHYRSTDSACVNAYLSASAINESTDLISQYAVYAPVTAASDGHEMVRFMGIPAGTYTLRLKQVSTNTTRDRMQITGWTVYTDDPIQPNKYVVDDMNTNGQGISHPHLVARETQMVNSGDRVPNTQKLNQYKFGIPSWVRYSTEGSNAFNYDFNARNYVGRLYYANFYQYTQTDYSEAFQLCKSMSYIAVGRTSHSQNAVGFIDGRQIPNSFSSRVQVKGGSASTEISSYPAMMKNFEAAVTMSGKVVTLSDTRGIRIGQPIILVDNTGATEKNYVESINADVSVTVRNPLSVLIDTNVNKLIFYGIHSMKVRNDDASVLCSTTYDYEPLDLTPSRFKRLVSSGTRLEQVSNIHEVGNGSIIPLPVFSDGTEPSMSEVEYYLLSNRPDSFFDIISFPFASSSAFNFWVRVSARKMIGEDTRVIDWRY
jgi:hypothetical protein